MESNKRKREREGGKGDWFDRNSIEAKMRETISCHCEEGKEKERERCDRANAVSSHRRPRPFIPPLERRCRLRAVNETNTKPVTATTFFSFFFYYLIFLCIYSVIVIYFFISLFCYLIFSLFSH